MVIRKESGLEPELNIMFITVIFKLLSVFLAGVIPVTTDPNA